MNEYKNQRYNDLMKPVANKLKEKYPSVIGHIDMDKILFVSVDGSAPKIDDHIFGAADLFKGVKISKMPLALTEIIYQESEHCYFWKIEFKSWLFERYGCNVITSLLYHCLRCISTKGTIMAPDRFGWSELMEHLPSNWYDPDASDCPDILEDNILQG